jgi:hypothetical protein
MVPIPSIASQPGGFDTKDCADVSGTNFSDHALETRAIYQTGARTTKIFIDYDNLSKAQLASALGQPVLTKLAFMIMLNLPI